MIFKINKDRAVKLSGELNLSDIKILFSLGDYIDHSGFVVITKELKEELVESLNLTRQTVATSINRLYDLGYIVYDRGKTLYNKTYIDYDFTN